MPVEFFFEERFKDSVVVTPHAPPFCSSFILPGSELVYTNGKPGSILSQEINGDDYSIDRVQHYLFFYVEAALIQTPVHHCGLDSSAEN